MSAASADAQQEQQQQQPQQSTETRDSERDVVLEKIALNENNTMPWPELRTIIRQKLAQAVDTLTHRQENRQNRSQDESGTGNQLDTSTAEAQSSRKRTRSEDTGKTGDTRPPGQQAGSPEDNSESIDQDAEGIEEETSESQHIEDPDSVDVQDIHDLEERINYCLRTFDEAPFTIQRIAELLMWPERHYRNVIKFLRAVERVVYVTSTVEEFPTTAHMQDENDGGELLEDSLNANAPPSVYSFVDTASVTARGSGLSDGNVQTRASPGDASVLMPKANANANASTVPLDASDTGILHIQPTSTDDTETMSKIRDNVDADVPVYIDDHVGGSSKLTVKPVFPEIELESTVEPSEVMSEVDALAESKDADEDLREYLIYV
ncbi:PPP4R2-domain-containing protein [Kickxella alabastrina]|uniref:PPP4R2-domain-containing protein n=1 Tax=Kickxella alabastrina TaxID=61397 RepID=UPI00221F5176|nr:PPP4R2-domain-containing protein [Kickxella alabastrina]KAI7825474.1 PPP4R2-domain-containing protein [Kickxella alabastrina]